jgi:hypothetical protein
MTGLQKTTHPIIEISGRFQEFDFLGPINQELRMNLSYLNPGDINQIL